MCLGISSRQIVRVKTHPTSVPVGAAARAVESSMPDSLFIDPLAEVLAGPKALEVGRKIASGQASKEV